MKIEGGSGPATTDIDMTPMIDIVFQLLTFFMVVINFDAADTDERVKMAISDLARPPKVKPADEVVIQVGYLRKDNVVQSGPYVFYMGENIPLEQFATRVLKREKAYYRLKHPQGAITSTVVIRADAECPAGKVQALIKDAQAAGYEKFSLKAMQPDG